MTHTVLNSLQCRHCACGTELWSVGSVATPDDHKLRASAGGGEQTKEILDYFHKQSAIAMTTKLI